MRQKTVFNVGDEWRGYNKVDMINNIFKTHYKQYMRSSVKLEKYGEPNMIAWFVNLNGEIHGTGKDWLWINHLYNSGTFIEEECVSISKEKYEYEMKKHLYPIRAVFQLDPHNRGNNYECRFLGVFKLTKHDTITCTKDYDRIADKLELYI